MIEYIDWAKGKLSPEHQPSTFDWVGMTTREMASRALAICELAKDGTSDCPILAFLNLEKMAQALKERYDG